jgi:hypothetical protein
LFFDEVGHMGVIFTGLTSKTQWGKRGEIGGEGRREGGRTEGLVAENSTCNLPCSRRF